jgi:Phosphatidylinositol 3- and 4-kinase
VFAYDVVVTSANSGYLQHVPGKTFFELNQKIAASNNIPSKLTNGDGGGKDDNGDEIGWDHVNLEQLAPSLVGSYVANFILGTRDRHEHNMMVVGDLKKDPKLMQIDFGYILMEYPGGVHFDTPRLTMPVPLIDRLNDADGIDGFSSLMEHLQQDMLAAYLVLRRHAVELIHFCQVILSPTHDPNAVESFLRGSHSLRTHESEKASSNYFSRKIETQFSRFVFRREVRQHMVASYYTFHRGMEFSKYFRSRSKRRLLMTRAAEALKIALPTETPEDKVDITRRKCLSRSLSANDLPSMDGSQTSRRFADCQSGGHHKGQNIWSRDEWDSSIGEDSDTEEYFSAQSEPEFL